MASPKKVMARTSARHQGDPDEGQADTARPPRHQIEGELGPRPPGEGLVQMRWATALMRAACSSLTASDISRPIMRTRTPLSSTCSIIMHPAGRAVPPPRAKAIAA